MVWVFQLFFVLALLKFCENSQDRYQNGTLPRPCGINGTVLLACCPMAQSESEMRCQEYRKKLNHLQVYGIAGGEDVLTHDFPHMAALGFGEDDSIEWQCGGSLISEKFILTAAHCLHSKSLGTVTWVRLGDLNLADTADDSDIQNVKVSRVIPHPEYRPWSVYHDIALLELEKNVKFTSFVKPVCLNTRIHSDFTAAATGWGLTSFHGEPSNQLQTVELESFAIEVCNDSYRSLISTRKLKHGIDHRTQLCAGSRSTNKDTCQGDSGGPLQMWRIDDGVFEIIGVTSFGKACGIKGTPGVYTKVSHYIPWIEKIVWPRNKGN